jgi:hypothetical protein
MIRQEILDLAELTRAPDKAGIAGGQVMSAKSSDFADVIDPLASDPVTLIEGGGRGHKPTIWHDAQ